MANELLHESSLSDSRYRQLFEHMITGIAFAKMVYEGDKPVDFIYLEVNKAFEALTGQRDIVGKRASEVIPWIVLPEPAILERCARIDRSGNPEYFERFVKSMHTWFSITVYRSEPGYIVAVFHDINDQKRTEQILRNGEAQFSNALAMTNAGAWEYDVESDTFFFNDHFYRIYGTTAEREGGYAMSSADYALRFCHPDDAPMVAAEVGAAISTDDPAFNRYFEHRTLMRDGSIGYIAVRYFVVKNREGKTVKTYGVNQNITDRKKKEEERVRLQKQLVNALAMAGAGHWEYDPETDLFTFNDNFYRVYHTTVEAQGGYTMSPAEYTERFLPPGFPVVDPKGVEDAIKNPNADYITEGDHPVIFGDGQPGFIAIRINIIKDNEGRTIRVFGVNQDITERRRQEEELRKSQAQLAEALAMADACHWEYDPKTELFIFNDSFYRVYRTTAEAQGGYTMSPAEYSKRFFPPGTPQVIPRSTGGGMQVTAGAGWFRENEHPVIFGDGRQGFIAVRFSVTKDSEGRSIRVFGVNQDVTERRRQEEELRKSQAQLSNALAMADACHWEYDLATDLFTFNDDFYRIYHTTAEQQGGYTMSSKEYLEKFLPPDARRFDPSAVNNLPGSRDANFELQTDHPVIFGDGQRGYMAVSIWGGVRDKDGHIVRTYGVNQDITERVKREEERRKLEEQVQKGARMESLGLLAGGIAHDFNNLLSGIFGYLEMAREHAGPGKSAEYLSKALKTFARAKDLTLQLLTFSKGGAPCMTTGSLAPLLRETARFAMSGSRISPEFAITGGLWQCDFDENQIAQVIDNMVINAVQAMPLGGSLTIAAENVRIGQGEIPALAAGRYVRISLRDTGAGIPANILPRIFDPFFTTKQKGNGLGLAVAYSIVKKHRGDILVESEPGKGSVFHLYLPASSKEADPRGADEAAVHHGTGCILIMDDEPFIREIVGEMLHGMGYETREACNGKEAIAMIREAAAAKKPFRAAIMDLTIPGGMGGKDAIGKIRESDQELVAFVSSGYSEDPVMADPTAFGFTDKLQKPFMKTELAKVLGKHLC